jgi:hypothetical protein
MTFCGGRSSLAKGIEEHHLTLHAEELRVAHSHGFDE